MKRLTRFARLLGVLLALAACSVPAHAGLGDMLKQKAIKAVKGDKPKPAAVESGPIKSRMTPEVTAERLALFQKGMEIEQAEIEKGKKLLASLKTKEAYQECQQKAAASPEVQKIMMSIGNTPENATQDDMQKIVAKMNEDLAAHMLRHCGPDPNQYSAAQLTRDAYAKGSDASGLEGDFTYTNWKEWVLEFCKYLEKLQKQPDAAQQIAKIKDEGLRIPGQGKGIFFVYTATEAKLLIDSCGKLKPLIEATF